MTAQHGLELRSQRLINIVFLDKSIGYFQGSFSLENSQFFTEPISQIDINRKDRPFDDHLLNKVLIGDGVFTFVASEQLGRLLPFRELTVADGVVIVLLLLLLLLLAYPCYLLTSLLPHQMRLIYSLPSLFSRPQHYLLPTVIFLLNLYISRQFYLFL